MSLHTFFSMQGSRVTVIDSFEITLDSDTLLLDPVLPVADLNGSEETVNNQATFYEVIGPDDGSAAVAFTTGASNVGDLDASNLNNLKISIPVASIAVGDQLLVGGTPINITGTSDTAEVSFSGTYFKYVITDSSGVRTVTFTSLSGEVALPHSRPLTRMKRCWMRSSSITPPTCRLQ